MSEDKRIKEALNRAEIPCSSELSEKLYAYMKELLIWNEKVNMTAITKEEEFIEKHYVDSLEAVKIAEIQEAESILDLGTGGGFPGIPLALYFPEKKFALMDSLEKRLNIIEEIAKNIGIKNIKLIHRRAEDAGQDNACREKFDVVVSRAVAELSVLSELALPLVSAGGAFIAYKSADIEEELDKAENAIKILGGSLSRIKKAKSGHILVVIKKISQTPKEYPRKAGTPKRKPL